LFRSCCLACFAVWCCLALPRLGGGAEGPTGKATFIRGDANGDGIVSLADVIAITRYFHSGQMPPCSDAADFDDSGTLEITDLINLVNFLYLKGPYPAEPNRTPLEDPTPDSLGCGALPEGGGGSEPGDGDEGQVIDFIEFFALRVDGYPGETGIQVPIVLSNSRGLDGFSISVRSDPRKVWLQDIQLPRYLPGRVKPELAPLYTDRLAEGYLARSVFMDFYPPFEGHQIPPGSGRVVATLVFSLSPEVKPQEVLRIDFENIPPGGDLRPTPINELSTDGRSIRPAVDERGISIVVSPPGELFLRGDSNRDLALNITDVILILRYLFLGESLACADAADADDSGAIDISDVIMLADHLFGSGWALPPPYPNPGRDLTPDSLPDCR
jgi:hypothetical protein